MMSNRTVFLGRIGGFLETGKTTLGKKVRAGKLRPSRHLITAPVWGNCEILRHRASVYIKARAVHIA